MANEIYRKQNMEQVLMSALFCFEETGFYNTKLETIAKRAGVTLRSVTRYYGTKDNLIIKVLERYNNIRMDAIYSMFVENAHFQSMTGFEQVECIMMKGLDLLKNRPSLIICISEIERYLIRNRIGHELQAQFDEYFIIMKKLTENAINKGVQDHSIRKTAILEDAVSFIVDLYWPILQHCAHITLCRSEKVNPEKYCNAYISGILKSLE